MLIVVCHIYNTNTMNENEAREQGGGDVHVARLALLQLAGNASMI